MGEPEEEYLYVVDENDEVLGRAARSKCHQEGLIHRSVYVIVINDKGEIFLQKRSMRKELYPGYYACSATGHVEHGEIYEEAAKREMKEELGIEAPLKEICKFKCFSEEEREISVLYLCRYDGQIEPNAEEISEGEFLSIEDIRAVLMNGGRKIAYGSIIALREFLKYLDNSPLEA
ncbi:MAG: NUDIX domain-containing protein [Candidatus Bathyarchaeia archaeon]|nr:NUDIX domain-containing protein [Candidatus Bathyarchaeota archaeon]